jgi:hypothetical protein
VSNEPLHLQDLLLKTVPAFTRQQLYTIQPAAFIGIMKDPLDINTLLQ